MEKAVPRTQAFISQLLLLSQIGKKLAWMKPMVNVVWLTCVAADLVDAVRQFDSLGYSTLHSTAPNPHLLNDHYDMLRGSVGPHVEVCSCSTRYSQIPTFSCKWLVSGAMQGQGQGGLFWSCSARHMLKSWMEWSRGTTLIVVSAKVLRLFTQFLINFDSTEAFSQNVPASLLWILGLNPKSLTVSWHPKYFKETLHGHHALKSLMTLFCNPLIFILCIFFICISLLFPRIDDEYLF